MKLDLAPTGTDQPPIFTDLAQCRIWQQGLPMSNPIQVQAQLLRQLHLLNRFTLAGETRLVILEALREPIHFVQAESAKRFSGKPLPLAPPEQAALDTSHSLWLALANGYLRCLDDCLAEDASRSAGMLPQAGMICQRALGAMADDHCDLVRSGSQPIGAHWRLAHQLYAGAEALGVATAPSEDGMRTSQLMTPAGAYAELMLLQAANLHELTPRQQSWVMRWARRWAGKTNILSAPPADSAALPLCVDLASSAPAGFQPLDGPGARWIETAELRRSLKKRLTLLAKGAPEDTPARLGLGDDCVQPTCGEMLRRVYPRWVKGGVRRRQERHPLSGASRFVAGVDAIYYYLSSHQPFKPPGGPSNEELQRQREEFATFGRIAARFEEEYSRNHGYQLENWEVIEDWGTLDSSSGGLRLVRPLKQVGGRLGIGQLVAVQPAGTSGLQLGAVRWVQVNGTEGDSLSVGIQVFPGKPQGVALRGTGVMAMKEEFKPGFLLPPVVALEMPAAIVLPPSSFKPKRIMEVWAAGKSRRIRLKELLDRGADYERAVCEDMPD